LAIYLKKKIQQKNKANLENPYSWLISSPKKSFIVRANSDRERQEWLTHLERCINYVTGTFIE